MNLRASAQKSIHSVCKQISTDMMIQRWQSVWLLLAAFCVAVFCFLPIACLSFEDPAAIADDSATMLFPRQNIVFWIVCMVVALLLIINIFLYRDTRRQKLVTVLSMCLIAVLAACACLMGCQFGAPGATVEWLGSILLLPGAFIFALLAYRGIRHDENLLKAADRLR